MNAKKLGINGIMAAELSKTRPELARVLNQEILGKTASSCFKTLLANAASAAVPPRMRKPPRDLAIRRTIQSENRFGRLRHLNLMLPGKSPIDSSKTLVYLTNPSQGE